jgi:hypothetical protein
MWILHRTETSLLVLFGGILNLFPAQRNVPAYAVRQFASITIPYRNTAISRIRHDYPFPQSLPRVGR